MADDLPDVNIDLSDVSSDIVRADLDQVTIRVVDIPAEVRAQLAAVEQRLESELVARAREKADNDVLSVRSGKFLGSIGGTVKATETGVIATVFSTDPIAGALEYGAQLPAHDISPSEALVLHFDGRFAAHVHFPGATLAPHPTIHAAFAEMEGEIYDEISSLISADMGLGDESDPKMLPGEAQVMRSVQVLAELFG